MARFTVSIPSTEIVGATNAAAILDALGPVIRDLIRARIREGLDNNGARFPAGMDFQDTGQFLRSIRASRVRKPKPGHPPLLAISVGPRGVRREARGKASISGGRGRGKGRGQKRTGARVRRNIDVAMFWTWRTKGERVPLIGLRARDERMIRAFLAERLKVKIKVTVT